MFLNRLTKLNQISLGFLGWSPFKIVSVHSRRGPFLKMSSNLNCYCMTINISSGFFDEIFLSANLFRLCIFWLKITLILSAQKLQLKWLAHFPNYLWHPHVLYTLGCQIENQVSDYRLLRDLSLYVEYLFSSLTFPYCSIPTAFVNLLPFFKMEC